MAIFKKNLHEFLPTWGLFIIGFIMVYMGPTRPGFMKSVGQACIYIYKSYIYIYKLYIYITIHTSHIILSIQFRPVYLFCIFYVWTHILYPSFIELQLLVVGAQVGQSLRRWQDCGCQHSARHRLCEAHGEGPRGFYVLIRMELERAMVVSFCIHIPNM